MKLSAPKQVTWWIAIILGGLAILNHYGVLSVGLGNNFVLLMLGYLLLVLGTYLKGL
ncbi:MAG: hypothetical protein KIS85_00180 [Anaerolineales bacterium]|nr:hypothetical protein [Anaerolineales bacterium]